MTFGPADDRYYEAIGDRFGEWMNQFDVSERRAWFVGQVTERAKPAVLALDVGCGLGHFSAAVEAAGHPVVSLDIAAGMLRRQKFARPLNASALQLPIADSALDLVVSSECIEHTPDPAQAIREMVRVLAPGGLLVLSCPNRAWRWTLPVAQALGVRKYSGIENWPSRRQVRRVFEESGAEVLAADGLHLVPFQLALLQPLSAWLNRHAQALRSLMINQCWVVRRRA